MRVLGVALILYGAFGLLLAGAGSVVGIGMATRVEQVTTDVEGSLQAAASTVQRASTSFQGFERSLVEADAAARNAASVARDSSATMASLGGAMSITIFGAQPLLPLARDFERGAEQLTVLAGDLDRLAGALVANRDDVREIRADLAVLGERLDQLSGSVPGDAVATAQGPPLRLLVIGLVLWVAIQAAGAIVCGVLILRRPVL
jgi:hypothetical protein